MLIFELTSLAKEIKVYHPEIAITPELLEALVVNLANAFEQCYGFILVPVLHGKVNCDLVESLHQKYSFDKYIYSLSCSVYVNRSCNAFDGNVSFRMRRIKDNVVIIHDVYEPALNNLRIE